MFDIGCDHQLNEIAVSDRGTLGGLTQFCGRRSLPRFKPLNANEIEERLASEGLLESVVRYEAPLADSAQLEGAHGAEHVRRIFERAPAHGLVEIDPDTYMGPHSLVAALRAAGGVLLATDLAPTSGPATDEAFAMARRDDAELLIVSVIDPTSLRLPSGRFQTRIDQVREQRESAAQDLVRRGQRDGVRVTFLIWEGDPAESILDAAGAEGAEVIVIGSHARGRIGRLLLGSVSHRVAEQAAVPVVVVPRGG